jgi:hypothetical protein
MDATINLKPILGTGPNAYGRDPSFFADRLNAYVREGVARATVVVKNVMEVVPQDAVLPANAIDFAVNEAHRIEYYAPGFTTPGTMHRNATQQLSQRLGIPLAYVDHLREQGEWGYELLVRSLRQHTLHSEDRYLVRSVGGEARAFLSDKFRRIDCRPSAAALLEVAKERGLVVADGIFTETRTSLKFILPKLLEVFPGEWMVLGFDWSNSDFGRGANDLRMFAFRPLCWNGMVGESVVRQIHIGKRLEDDIAYSEKTYRLDAEATASALRDTASHALSEARVDRLLDGIRIANETKIEPKARVDALRKVVTKGEAERVVEAFNSPDVENMPPGNSLWRWSNAISFVAGQLEDADKKIDFERYAGDVIKGVLPKLADAA